MPNAAHLGCDLKCQSKICLARLSTTSKRLRNKAPGWPAQSLAGLPGDGMSEKLSTSKRLWPEFQLERSHSLAYPECATSSRLKIFSGMFSPGSPADGATQQIGRCLFGKGFFYFFGFCEFFFRGFGGEFFQGTVHMNEQFAHDRRQRDFGWFVASDQALVKLFEHGIGRGCGEGFCGM